MEDVRCLIHSIEEVLPILPIPPDDNNSRSSPQHSGLDGVSDNDLRQHLEPIREALSHIDAVALLNLKHLSKANGGAPLIGPNRNQYIQPIHNEITPPTRGIRYVHIQEVKDCYSIGIFVFPPRSIIPLHDHPHMAVLSRILYGEILVQAYDIGMVPPSSAKNQKTLKDNDSDQDSMDISDEEDYDDNYNNNNPQKYSTKPTSQNQKGWLSSLLSLGPNLLGRKGNESQERYPQTETSGSIYAIEKERSTLQSPDISILYPRRGNMHEFVAGDQGAAILDVLLPPYDVHDGRDCTFYRADKLDQPNRCLLVPTEQPPDYQCISGRYKELGGF